MQNFKMISYESHAFFFFLANLQSPSAERLDLCTNLQDELAYGVRFVYHYECEWCTVIQHLCPNDKISRFIRFLMKGT